MPVHDFVDVRVVVNGQPLQEYPEPDDEEAGENQIVRYVEATVDQRFEVYVRWLPGFQLKNASNLVPTLQLDGQSWVPSRPIECKGLPLFNNTLSAEQSYSFQAATVNLGEGRVKRASFTFGALDIIESAETRASLKVEQLRHLGEIKLTTYRGGKVTMGSEYISPQVDVCDQVPEKLLKGRLLKNNVRNVHDPRICLILANSKYRYDVSEIDANPTLRSWTCKSLGGQAGRVSVFVFKYRSRKILQRLGCIPRSPSPEQDYALISERQEDLIRLGKERQRQANLENLRLRQRIEQLEGSNNPTIEPRSVKREREETIEELVEVAPPPRRISAIIDLTEDD